MKFHKERTAIKSQIEGMAAYEKAFNDGRLVPYPIYQAKNKEQSGIWRKITIADIKYRDEANREPLEISDVYIKPRAPILDELTRHRNTFQVFLPITGEILVVMAPSKQDDSENPDPNQIVMVPAKPGEAVEVCAGTWHTLPFAFVSDVIGLSIMHREHLDSYHDVRDLAALGWIGLLKWKDPE